MSLESVFKLSLVMNMIDNLSGPMAGIASRVGADVSKLDAASQVLGGAAKTGTVMREMGGQITEAVLAPVAATFETRRALGELSSLGVKKLDVLESAAREFSNQWSGTSKADFISAAYDIKSGISSLTDEGVAEYTSLSGLTAKATKSTVGEMTSLFATGYGIYKGYYDDLTDIEFGEMFSAGIAESVRAFKTSGSGMAQGIQTLGASATTANVPLEEQLAILGMLQATMSGSEAGTKYKAFLRSAAKGGEALGLSFLDTNNQLLSMPEILDLLRGKFGETMDAAEKMELQKAFGDAEAVALIDLMYSKTGDLQDNILNLYDAMGQGTQVALEMASAMQETEPERFERLQQRLHNVAESIGNTLLPTINDLMGKGEQVLTKAGNWIEQNQELVRVIMMVALAIGGFLTVGGTLITVISGVGLVITKSIGAYKMLKAGLLLVNGAMAPLISSVWAFTAALMANPVTWIVIGIVALIAALILLYGKCEWFRNGVNAILGFFKEKLGMALETTTAIFQGIGNIIGSAIGTAKEAASQKLEDMRAAYESHGGGIQGAATAAMEGVKGIYTAGFSFLDNLTGGKLTKIKEKFSEKLGPISNLAGSIMDAAVSTVSEKLENMRAAYESHGGGIQGIAAAAVEGIKGYYLAGFTFLDKLTGGKLTEIRDKFVEKLSPVSGLVGSLMDFATATASEKLENMRAAYESHGGGIQGVAAAAMEGVKGCYTAGFAFLDSLTGGKLTEIKDQFSEKLSLLSNVTGFIMDSAVSTVSEKLENMRTAYESHGGGIQGVAAAAMEGVKGCYTAGFTFLDNLTGGKLTEIRDKFVEKLSPVSGLVGSLMDFATATASEKLNNMRAAYESHGGGIQGIAAAAVEGVKGCYIAGFTFLDSLTGGKLTEIKNKFETSMSGMVRGVSQRFMEARTAFSNGLSDIRSSIDGAVTWFFTSGQRVVTTFANGIRSTFSNAVDAVKDGLQRIRNMLPFSDAKEGPLSTLTLSGQRTMTTYAHGLALANDAPAEEARKGLAQTKAAFEREPVKRVNLSGGERGETSGDNDGQDSDRGKTVIIQKLIMPVDLKKIKDLQSLLAILKEIEDVANSDSNEDPAEGLDFMVV